MLCSSCMHILSRSDAEYSCELGCDYLHYEEKVGVYQYLLVFSNSTETRRSRRERLTQWVTAAQLRLLGVLGGKLVTNTVQKLNVALLRILLHGSDESPRHSTSSLSGDCSIGPVRIVSKIGSGESKLINVVVQETQRDSQL